MNFQDYYTKMKFLCDLIEKGSTGTADELSAKLHVSRRTVFRYMDVLRDKGACIRFSKTRGSYVFEEGCDFYEKFL